MSTILLPDRRIALPDPGPVPSSRRRAARLWRRILGPRAAYTFWDPGACGCPTTGCSGGGAPCTLPAANLTLTLNSAGVCTPDPVTTTLLYGGSCNWNTTCIDRTCSGQPHQTSTVYMGLTAGGCFYFVVVPGGGAGCPSPGAWTSYMNPALCANSLAGGTIPGTPGNTMSGPNTFTCSPLNLVFRNGAFAWTVNP